MTMEFTKREYQQFYHGISMSLLSKKSAQKWRYDDETAEEIRFLEGLESKVLDKIRQADAPQTETQIETQNSNLTFEKDECAKEYEELGLKELKELIEADRKTESNSEKPNNCDTCRNKGFEGCEQPCLGCGCCGLYEPKDEPITQMKTQNSNLTFEKDECVKEYEELGLKELKELIEADRKDEFFREPTAEERKAVADYIDSISVPTGVNIFDLMDEPTISKMEQVDKDINVRSKDEPTWEQVKEYCNKRCLDIVDSALRGKWYKEEPHIVGKHADMVIIDEAQTDCYMCKWLGEVDVCGRCRNRNLFCEADTEPKPKDEPQTDCAWGKDG